MLASKSSARTLVVTFPVPNSMLQYLSQSITCAAERREMCWQRAPDRFDSLAPPTRLHRRHSLTTNKFESLAPALPSRGCDHLCLGCKKQARLDDNFWVSVFNTGSTQVQHLESFCASLLHKWSTLVQWWQWQWWLGQWSLDMILTQSHDGSASDTNHADVSDANLPRLQAIQRPTAASSYAMCSSLSIFLCISNTLTFGLLVILGFIENPWGTLGSIGSYDCWRTKSNACGWGIAETCWNRSQWRYL